MKDIAETVDEVNKAKGGKKLKLEKNTDSLSLSLIDSMNVTGTEMFKIGSLKEGYRITYSAFPQEAQKTLFGKSWEKFGNNINPVLKDIRKDYIHILENEREDKTTPLYGSKSLFMAHKETSVYEQAKNALDYFYNSFEFKLNEEHLQD